MKPEIKTYKPITPGLRHRIDVKDKNLWKGKPCKKLVKGLTKTGGRNQHGRITIRRRGGGHKRLYRTIDLQRNTGLYTKNNTVLRIEYDPNRTGYIALCQTETGKLFYILAPEGLKAGDTFAGRLANSNTSEVTNESLNPKIGESLPLQEIPKGALIYNVETKPGEGGKLARSAGVSCILIENLENSEYTMIQLPSGKRIQLLSNCLATIGEVSKSNHNKIILGKAGRKRWLGRKPKVRGEAMNPIDHPHGGKSHGPGGLNTQPRTKWGKLAKWRKTAKAKPFKKNKCL